MWSFNHFLMTLCAALSCVSSAAALIHVFGYEGKDVRVPCKYDHGYEDNEKYLCKDDCSGRSNLITTSQGNKTKYFIYDDRKTRVFTVTISDLHSADAGMYSCGVSRWLISDHYTEVKLEIRQDSCCDEVIKIQSHEEASVSIICPYESVDQNQLKYICRGKQPSTCLQQAVITSDSTQSRRFTLTDDKMSSFTVNIGSLTLEDSGSYLCGVHRNTGLDVFSAVELEVKAALCCVSSAAGFIHVFGYEGRDVKIPCNYDEGYEDNEKYLCRNDCGDSDVITTYKGNKTKYFIYDDREKRVFTVTISDLRFTDAGKYWCGITRTGKDIYTEVKLETRRDSCCDEEIKIQSHEEASVSIICPYESVDQNQLKYICRGKQPSTCLQQAVITSDSTQSRRFTLTDDKMSSFTVNISSLTLEDSGSYLCGVHRNTGLDVFSAVELEVKEWCCVKTKTMSGTVGRPVTLQCPYPPHHQNNHKFLCKGDKHNNCTDTMSQSRFTLHDVSSSSFLVTITELEAGDAGTYWCGSDSRWRVGNYTNIHLSVDQTSTVTPNIKTSTETVKSESRNITHQYIEAETHYSVLVYVLPAVLISLLILTIVLVMVLKNKCNRFQDV